MGEPAKATTTCDFARHDRADEPCWGSVREIRGTDTGGQRVTANACEGHACRWTIEAPGPVEMFAVRRGEWLHSFFPHAGLCGTCTDSDPVVRVRVTPDDSGDHWSWWDTARGVFLFTNGHREGVEICFPYGTKVDEERGRGKVIRVRVDVLREATEEELR